MSSDIHKAGLVLGILLLLIGSLVQTREQRGRLPHRFGVFMTLTFPIATRKTLREETDWFSIAASVWKVIQIEERSAD
jgi:hypothetical protein